MSTTNTTHDSSTTAWLGEMAAELTAKQLGNLNHLRRELAPQGATEHDQRQVDACLVGDAYGEVEHNRMQRPQGVTGNGQLVLDHTVDGCPATASGGIPAARTCQRGQRPDAVAAGVRPSPDRPRRTVHNAGVAAVRGRSGGTTGRGAGDAG